MYLACGKLGNMKPDYRVTDKITKEEWWISKSKREKKKACDQRSETSDNKYSYSESSDNPTTARVLGWSRTHLRPKGNVAHYENNFLKENAVANEV